MTTVPLSVVMTVFNGASQIGETLDSILAQTFTDFELLINDDGSQDSTWDVLSRYAARDERIRLIRNELNCGITRSMNKLFAMAHGDLITRHDADDISLPDRFARQVMYMEQHAEIGLVSSQVLMIDATGAPLDLKYFTDATEDQTLQAQLLVNNCFCQGSVMFRKRCLEVVGNYDESLDSAEDYDLWLRLAEVTRLARLPEYLYKYRVHAASISSVKRGLQLQNMAASLEKLLSRRASERANAAIQARVAGWYVEAANWFIASGDLLTAQLNLTKALRVYPALLDSDEPKLSLPPTAEGLTLIESAFREAGLPARWVVLKHRLIAALYMREVFVGLGSGNAARIDAALWPGLRHNPLWVFNRGVLSLSIRRLRSRLLL
jgi:glycosyltransferase involved in cell wall biosynthesis